MDRSSPEFLCGCLNRFLLDFRPSGWRGSAWNGVGIGPACGRSPTSRQSACPQLINVHNRFVLFPSDCNYNYTDSTELVMYPSLVTFLLSPHIGAKVQHLNGSKRRGDEASKEYIRQIRQR